MLHFLHKHLQKFTFQNINRKLKRNITLVSEFYCNMLVTTLKLQSANL